MTFASRVKNLKQSGIREIFDLSATIEKCINLSIGQADFEVPAPIRRAAASAIEEGHNRYTPTGGLPALREGVLRRVRERTGARVNSALITSGASGALVLGLMAMVEHGDEVLIPDPYFVLYKALVELCGGVPVYYDTYPDFRPKREEFESKVTEKTKLILVNSPGNPTGVCYTEDDLKMIADVAGKKRLLVLSDEIYYDFVYDSKPLSMLQFYPNTLMVSGFSKSFAMAGWRMGYAVGPAPLLEVMETIQQFTFICAPAPFQEACADGLDCDISHHIAEYRQKRDLVYEGLKDHLEMTKPDGAFYMFAKVPWPGRTGRDFAMESVKRSLLLVPGGAFSTRDTHFRLSFAAPNEDLEAAVNLLREMALQPA